MPILLCMYVHSTDRPAPRYLARVPETMVRYFRTWKIMTLASLHITRCHGVWSGKASSETAQSFGLEPRAPIPRTGCQFQNISLSISFPETRNVILGSTTSRNTPRGHGASRKFTTCMARGQAPGTWTHYSGDSSLAWNRACPLNERRAFVNYLREIMSQHLQVYFSRTPNSTFETTWDSKWLSSVAAWQALVSPTASARPGSTTLSSNETKRYAYPMEHRWHCGLTMLAFWTSWDYSRAHRSWTAGSS